MAKFTMSVRTRGYFHVEVEAESYDEAKRKAEEAWSEADFGELEAIDGDVYSAESVEDNVVHYYL